MGCCMSLYSLRSAPSLIPLLKGRVSLPSPLSDALPRVIVVHLPKVLNAAVGADRHHRRLRASFQFNGCNIFWCCECNDFETYVQACIRGCAARFLKVNPDILQCNVSEQDHPCACHTHALPFCSLFSYEE